MSINKVILLGHVGNDPDVKRFDNGGMVAQVAIATTKRGFKTKDGKEIPEKTEWHNVVMQNGLASIADKYIHKGDKIYIEGELRTRSYEGKDGKRYITEIVASEVELLGAKKAGDALEKARNDFEPKIDDLPF